MKVTLKLGSGFGKAAEQATQRALSALASLARDRMTTLAQEKLKATAQSYVQSIATPVVSERSAVIVLSGRLANMMEKGTSPYDIKKMLRGREFVDVAFRHSRPGTGKRAMPKADFNVMRSVAAAAKGAMKVRGPRVMPTGPTTSATGYKHRESKFGSMLRIAHTYKGATQAQYLTIRRISKRSDPRSWIHPGFKPLGIFQLVAKEVRKLAPKLLADYVREGIR